MGYRSEYFWGNSKQTTWLFSKSYVLLHTNFATCTQNPQPDLATQSTIATMQKQIASLKKQLDELKTTVQPLQAMERHSLDLQEAKPSLNNFTQQLTSIEPIIMQVASLIPKIISMTETYA